ncbi:MAG TPA: hypothetical protein VGK59_11590 [Ohtaekwangia sp.]
MKNLLFIATLVVASLHAYGKKVPGTIITKGESKDVMLDLKVDLFAGEPNFERTQYKIKYYDETGKKQTLRPDDADEVIFTYEGLKVRMISCVNTLGSGDIFSSSVKIFLKLEIDGPLRLYRFYYKQSNPGYFGAGGTYTAGATYTLENMVFQKGNGPLKQSKGTGWRKDMRAYFSDCPALAERIENKDLGKKEIEAIVRYYNTNCGRNRSH